MINPACNAEEEEQNSELKPTPKEFNLNNPACNAEEEEYNSVQNPTPKELNINNPM